MLRKTLWDDDWVRIITTDAPYDCKSVNRGGTSVNKERLNDNIKGNLKHVDGRRKSIQHVTKTRQRNNFHNNSHWIDTTLLDCVKKFHRVLLLQLPIDYWNIKKGKENSIAVVKSKNHFVLVAAPQPPIPIPLSFITLTSQPAVSFRV